MINLILSRYYILIIKTLKKITHFLFIIIICSNDKLFLYYYIIYKTKNTQHACYYKCFNVREYDVFHMINDFALCG